MTTVLRRPLFVLGALGVLALATFGSMVVRWTALPSREPTVQETPLAVADPEGALERFRRLLRIPTVSGTNGHVDGPALEQLHAELRRSFPRVFAELRTEVVAGHSLLIEWPGRDPAAPTSLLLGHLDVVPADAAEWTHDPFAAELVDGNVWGRGTLDDKINVAGILEAVEQRLAESRAPLGSIWLAFGHDEEISGQGAVAMAARLDDLGVRPALVLDEGLAVVLDQVPGLEAPAALIGVAEKTAITIDLVAAGAGGHASMPPADTASVLLGRALARLGDANLPTHLDGPTGDFLDTIAPEVGLPLGLVLANRGILGSVIASQLGASPAGNALLHTTLAPTMLSASPKENVLPTEARARINVRLHPEDRLEDIVASMQAAIDDPRVRIEVPDDIDPAFSPPISTTDHPSFDKLRTAIGRTFPEALVAPSLVIGATDARHYTDLSDQVYRFTPMVLDAEALESIHGIDERISAEGFERAASFYLTLLQELSH